MNKISIWIACLICGKFLFASAENSQTLEISSKVLSEFGYFECGLGPVPFTLPALGVGYRKQIHHSGFDVSLNAITAIFYTNLKGSLLYLWYPKPSPISQFYFGIGMSIGNTFFDRQHPKDYFISTELLVGRNCLNYSGDRRFFQVRASVPALNDSLSFYNKPLITFIYGIGF